MTEEQRTPPRALGLLAILLVMLGSCGTVGGALGLEVNPIPRAADAVSGGGEDDAAEQAGRKAIEVLLLSEWRRPLAGANLVVSTLLVVAGVSLLRRRPTAIWWTTQACLANGLLAVAEGVTQTLSLRERWNEIVHLSPAHADVGLSTANETAQAIVVAAAIRLALYAFLIWRVRRADVRGVLPPRA